MEKPTQTSYCPNWGDYYYLEPYGGMSLGEFLEEVKLREPSNDLVWDEEEVRFQGINEEGKERARKHEEKYQIELRKYEEYLNSDEYKEILRKRTDKSEKAKATRIKNLEKELERLKKSK